MRKVLLAALICLVPVPFAGAAPVPMVKFDPPTVTAQSSSVDDAMKCLFAWIRTMSPSGAREVEGELLKKLGEKGWAGVDVTKPVGAYAYLKPKLENSSYFLVFPITKKAEALDFLERLQFGAEAEKNDDGLYRIRKRDFFPDEIAVRLRFKDSLAYIGINVDPEEMDSAKLLPPRAWIDEKDKAPLTVRFHFGVAPKEAKEYVDTQMLQPLKKARDELVANPPNGMPLTYPPFATELLNWCDRNLSAGFRDGEVLSVRFDTEPKSRELSVEARLKPKAKSKYSEEIAKWKGAEGRFQQLATKDSIAGWGIQASLLPVPFATAGGPFFAEMIKMMGRGGDPNFLPCLDALGDAVQRMSTAGTFDFGAALHSQNKDGLYTAVAALAFPDPSTLEKALRKYVEGSEDFKKLVKFDAEKLDKLAVHVLEIPEPPESLVKAFGKKPTIRVAFAADAVYAAFGPDGLAEIEKAMKLKAASCKVSEMKVHPKKAMAFVTTVFKEAEPIRYFRNLLGEEDALKTHWSVDSHGGEDYFVRYSQQKFGLFSIWGRAMDLESEEGPGGVLPPLPVKPVK